MLREHYLRDPYPNPAKKKQLAEETGQDLVDFSCKSHRFFKVFRQCKVSQIIQSKKVQNRKSFSIPIIPYTSYESAVYQQLTSSTFRLLLFGHLPPKLILGNDIFFVKKSITKFLEKLLCIFRSKKSFSIFPQSLPNVTVSLLFILPYLKVVSTVNFFSFYLPLLLFLSFISSFYFIIFSLPFSWKLVQESTTGLSNSWTINKKFFSQF